MRRKVTAVEARKRFGEVLEGVFYRGDEVVIERQGKPMAVVIPAELYASIRRARDEVFEQIERNWERNKDVNLAEIDAAVDEAVRAAREKARKPRSAD